MPDLNLSNIQNMQTIVQPNSHITLNYRISLEDGTSLISTFESTPATLQLGNGDLSVNLERCLVGVMVGQKQIFPLAAEQAFGVHNPQLVETMPLSVLPDDVEDMTLVEFTAPDGAKYAGLVREIVGDKATVDFNHPLAGRAIRFEVEVIGVL